MIEMIFYDVATGLIIAAVTGALSSYITIKSLKLHIEYIKEHLNRDEKALERAHSRIDALEKKYTHELNMHLHQYKHVAVNNPPPDLGGI